MQYQFITGAKLLTMMMFTALCGSHFVDIRCPNVTVVYILSPESMPCTYEAAFKFWKGWKSSRIYRLIKEHILSIYQALVLNIERLNLITYCMIFGLISPVVANMKQVGTIYFHKTLYRIYSIYLTLKYNT